MASQTSLKKVDAAITAARNAIVTLLTDEPDLGPQFIRIAFYDALSYNPTTKADGPNGSIRVWEGQDDEMKKAIKKLDNLKSNDISNVFLYISYADLYQLAGIEAVKKANGPTIEFLHGRTDSCIPAESNKIPTINAASNATTVREVFHQIGFTDKEIVALSSAFYYWMNYVHSSHPTSTLEQPKIDNTYYQKLLKEYESSKPKPSSTTNTKTNTSTEANTSAATNNKTSSSTPPENSQTSKSTTTTSSFHYWHCLLSDASFRKYVESFSKDPVSFKKEYASAHKKLSELGFKNFPQHIPTEAEYKDMKHGIAFAMAMTILFGFVGFFYEVMRA